MTSDMVRKFQADYHFRFDGMYSLRITGGVGDGGFFPNQPLLYAVLNGARSVRRLGGTFQVNRPDGTTAVGWDGRELYTRPMRAIPLP